MTALSSTGFLDKPALKQLTGAGTRAGQLAWLQRYVLRPDAAVLRAGQYPRDDESGLYALFDDDGALNYIGMSGQVGYRIVQHLWAARRGKRLPFVEYAVLHVRSDMLAGVEAAHIEALEPPENTAKPRACLSFHEQLVGAIREAWGPKLEQRTLFEVSQ